MALSPIPLPTDVEEFDRQDFNVWEYDLPKEEVEYITKLLREFFLIYHKLTQIEDSSGLRLKDELDAIRESEAQLSDALE